MWHMLFILCALLMFLLPLVPGLMEVKHKADVQPLRIVQEYDGDPAYFSKSFRQWLLSSQSALFGQHSATEHMQSKFHMVGENGVPAYMAHEIEDSSTSRLMIAPAMLHLGSHMFHEAEIYGAHSIHTGMHNHYRAMLAEGDIVLGEQCTVMRWIHSNGALHAGRGSKLFGRTTADGSIHIDAESTFERLHAPRIQFGAHADSPIPERNAGMLTEWNAESTPLAGTLQAIPLIKNNPRQRWMAHGELHFPADHRIQGDIVGSSRVMIGEGAFVAGSVKSNGDLHLASGACIDGAVVSTGSIFIGEGCKVAGPVISEHTVHIAPGVVIGTDIAPTTVTARYIKAGSGSVAHGSVWASKGGDVV